MQGPRTILGWITFAVALCAASAGLGLLGGPVAFAAEEDAMLREAHPWARFGKGAWRQVRIITEGFDEQGHSTGSTVTDNKTTVEEVTPDRVTLKVEATVEVSGQRFPSQPQILKQGYAGETVGQATEVKVLEPETIVIDGQSLRCETRQIEILGGVTREITRINYLTGHQPTILRRQTTTSDAAGAKPLHEGTTEVRAVQMTRRVLDEAEPKAAFLVRQEQRNDRGLTISWAWHVPEVPGEVVDQTSKKLDTAGRLVRRTTLELVAYGDAEGEPPPDPAGRRSRRKRR